MSHDSRGAFVVTIRLLRFKSMEIETKDIPTFKLMYLEFRGLTKI